MGPKSQHSCHDRRRSHLGGGVGTHLAVEADPCAWCPPSIRMPKMPSEAFLAASGIGGGGSHPEMLLVKRVQSLVHRYSCNSSAELKEGERINESIALQ